MSIARQEADEIRERILTGYKDGKPFTPYVPTVALPPLGAVLDFGCGLGRNFPFLARVAREVTGFDLPPMIERCRGLEPPGVVLTADWDALRASRFDLVVASLVLQHIDPEPVRAYLRDFARMSPLTYVLTRTGTDAGEWMLDVLAEEGLFRAGECVDVDHDPVTHQLRVLARRPFADARTDRTERHIEVLLRAGP